MQRDPWQQSFKKLGETVKKHRASMHIVLSPGIPERVESNPVVHFRGELHGNPLP